MKVSDKHQIISPTEGKKKGRKSQEVATSMEALKPKAQSSFIDISLKKNKKDLLVVESEALSLIVVKAIFERYNINFELVSTEAEALLAIEKNDFHIVLIGINDSEFLWEQLLSKVWESNMEDPKTFLMAITHEPTEHRFSEYLNKNYDKIILKPYKETDLIKVIKKYLKLTPKRKAPSTNHAFSLEQLRKLSNNSEVFVRSMLDKFIESAIECSETMKKAIYEKDIDKLKKAAHKGIPSYAILDLKSLTEILTKIERLLITEEDFADLTIKVKLFDEENTTVIHEIKNYLKQS